jgi:uncharacterized protein
MPDGTLHAMKWEQGRRSSNVEDRRGGRRSAGIAIGGGGGIVLVAALMLLMGKDPMSVLETVLGSGAGTERSIQAPTSPEEDRLADMCSVVLADTEDTWGAIFKKMGKTYVDPKLVIFKDYTESGCGEAESSTGPFYCPSDHKVYIDLRFYEELQDRFKAPGDFAQAYVIAHEVGHHVQYLLGTLQAVDAKMAKSSKAEANRWSVRLELQADFYAGIWAHYADKSRGLLEKGDLAEALNAASAIGDDNIQKRSRGYAVPETFTHGTSAQRLKYFKLGYETGDLKAFDLFK